MNSLYRRLERLEAISKGDTTRLTQEALRALSDEDLDALEVALEAGQENGAATFKELYAARSEISRRTLETLLETMTAIKEGRDPPEVRITPKESRNGYRIWKYYRK